MQRFDLQRPKASSALSRSQNASDSLEPGRPDNGSPPQQSVSRTQSSPAGRQPLGGWQMNTPAGPGPQARLQHCEQSVPHTMPAWPSLQRSGPTSRVPHEPTSAPSFITQLPLQQSALAVQMSFSWTQYDTFCEHAPSSQSAEQQSESLSQELPDDLQATSPLMSLQLPPSQMPLQQLSPSPHSEPSSRHAVSLQVPASQLKEQQSVFAAQSLPSSPQTITLRPQVLLGSQTSEQQSPAAAHSSPKLPHTGPTGPSPAPPAMPPLPPLALVAPPLPATPPDAPDPLPPELVPPELVPPELVAVEPDVVPPELPPALAPPLSVLLAALPPALLPPALPAAADVPLVAPSEEPPSDEPPQPCINTKPAKRLPRTREVVGMRMMVPTSQRSVAGRA